MQNYINSPRNSAGFTLIEILITVIVVSIGLLGLAGLQMSGLRANLGSEERSKATILANDIAERMHANQMGVDANNYAGLDTEVVNAPDGNDNPGCDTPVSPFCSSNSNGIELVGGDGCDAAEMAAFDAWVWTCGMPVADGVKRGGVINQLMDGSATVTCNDAPCIPGSAHTITVSWNSLNPDRSGDADNPEPATLSHSYTLVVVP